MFNLFGKHKETLYNPVQGQVMPLAEVADGVFSEKMMGDGFATEPASGEIFAPVKGEIISIFPTKHAIGLVTMDGKTEVLLHLGLDTVELKGQGFTLKVKLGDLVTEKTLLAQMDLAGIKAQGKRTTVMTIVTTKEKEIADLHTGANEAGVAVAIVR